jgi:hypothetical protein
MRIRFFAVLLVAALVLTFGVGCGKKAPDPTAWENVTAMIGPDGEVSLDMALKAFVVIYGPVPGVEAPKGKPVVGILSGTLAAAWVLEHWSKLKPEQRQRISELLRLPDGVRIANAALVPGLTRQPPPEKPIVCARADQVPAEPLANAAVAAMVEDMMEEIEANLGSLYFPPVRPVLCKSSQDLPSRALADTLPWFHNDGSFDCRITFFKTFLGKGVPSRAVTVHELMHCYMARMAGRATGAHVSRAIPAWIDEGIATFAAMHLTNDPTETAEFWPDYLLNPGKKLNTYTTNDAMGFFWHIENTRHDMWKTIEAIVKAPNGEASFEAAVAKTAPG